MRPVLVVKREVEPLLEAIRNHQLNIQLETYSNHKVSAGSYMTRRKTVTSASPRERIEVEFPRAGCVTAAEEQKLSNPHKTSPALMRFAIAIILVINCSVG
jgi:hypothetical protein